MYEKVVLDDIAISRALARISYEIIERSENINNVILVGVKTRGVYIAQTIKQNILRVQGVDLPCFDLNSTPFRDDFKRDKNAIQQKFDVENREVIIVDDVLFTGRTTRACIDGIMSMGRPSAIRLAVLCDRGHRELPIRADFVGKNLPTSSKERVVVKVEDIDQINEVIIQKTNQE